MQRLAWISTEGKRDGGTARSAKGAGQARARRPAAPHVPRLVAAGSRAQIRVDQTTISRLERGVQRGLSIRRLAAILDALKVGDVIFDRPPSVPQTELEIMPYGDHWLRAVAEADRRLRWAPPPTQEAAIDPVDEGTEPEFDREAWFGDRG